MGNGLLQIFHFKKFIECFVSNNKSLRHLFIQHDNNLIYSQFFNINLKNLVITSLTIQLQRFYLISSRLRLYLTNSFLQKLALLILIQKSIHNHF